MNVIHLCRLTGMLRWPRPLVVDVVLSLTDADVAVAIAAADGRTGCTTPLALAENFTPFEFAVSEEERERESARNRPPLFPAASPTHFVRHEFHGHRGYFEASSENTQPAPLASLARVLLVNGSVSHRCRRSRR